MKIFVFTLAMFLSSASSATETALYSVDLSEVLDVASKALKQVYPEISPDDVTLANDLYVQCWSTRQAEHVYALDESFKPCEALIEFDLTSTQVEHTYFNREGNCVTVTPPGVLFVYVYEDGSGKVETYRGRESEVQVVECTDEVISQIADEPKLLPGADKVFSVDPRRILERAFAAAIEDNPDTPPEDLDLDGMISLFCDVTVPPGGKAGRDLQIRPCTAELTFIDRSTAVEKRYMHERGRCFIGPSNESVRVHVVADGNAQVGRVEGDWTQVACNEEFDHAQKPSSD
jgi:hypothetical protein